MIADYSAEIKIAIFQSVRKRQRSSFVTNEDRRQIDGESRQKLRILKA